MIRFAKIILSAGLNGLALGLLALPATAAQPAVLPANLPLYFEANQGPAKGPAQFIARGRDCQFLISPVEAQMVLRKTVAESATVRMQFIGANAQAPIRGDAELPGKINYLTGNDPAQWRTGVPMFAKVRVGELYPGVNLVYYGNSQQLEYDFALAPGANPNAVRVHFDGVDKVAISKRGELILTLGDSEIRQPKPVIYQTIGGARKEVEGGYQLVDAHTVAFAVGQYDRNLPLVIDPILSYSTYFGGISGDTAWAVAVDTNGFVYIAGQTFSSRLTNNVALATPGAFQTNFAGGTLTGDAFVAKLDNAATNLIYLTYLGGSDDDAIFGVAVDDAGDAYVTGYTDSPNFPTTTNAFYKTISGTLNPHLGHYLIDAFVTELSPSGSNLIYSTYLGGSSVDSGIGIAVDSAGNAYVTGVTYSTNFPTTNAFQKKLACTNSLYFNANAFIAKIGPNGTNLAYSTYFGGTNFDQGTGIAVDSSNFVYVTGFTASTNFPNTNSFQKYLNGSTNQTSANDAFVAKFDSTGTNLLYSTFLGGTNNDIATHIAVDNQGAAYVTGWTTSTNFPNTVASLPNGLVNSLNSYLVTNVFLTKITNGTGTNAGIACSTIFGGNNIDIGYGVAVAASCVFVTGSASSTNFPTYSVPGLMRATNSGGNDAFVAAFDVNAFGPIYSVCLGGNSDDFGYGIAADSLGNAYIVGQTLSINFPTLNARQTTLNGTSDAFLTKIMLTVQPPVITTQPTNQAVGVGSSVTIVVAATGTAPLSYQWQVAGTNLVWTNLVNGGGIIGATTNVLTISDAQTTNSGNYLVIVTNYGGSVTSSVAVLTVTNVATVLTLQPTDQTVGVGSTVTFSVDGNAQPPFFLQWLKDGTNLVNGTNINGSTISGATNATLFISNAQTNDSGTYWIVVTNAWGVLASSNAVLTVVSFPTITVPPTNQTVGLGSVVTFAVTAVGTTPLSYRWQVNGTDLVNGGRIGGATNFALTITNAQTSDDGGYSVIVTNIVGSVTSSPPAVLTVLLSPLFGSIIVAGDTNGFILSGAGGTNNGIYYVLTSSNLLVSRTNWTHIATNHFDNTGHFIFTNAAQTNAPQEFFLLQMP